MKALKADGRCLYKALTQRFSNHTKVGDSLTLEEIKNRPTRQERCEKEDPKKEQRVFCQTFINCSRKTSLTACSQR